ncbi:hypothetical protein GIB67_036190, partial [Kingdonia uniflora]
LDIFIKTFTVFSPRPHHKPYLGRHHSKKHHQPTFHNLQFIPNFLPLHLMNHINYASKPT